MNSTSLCFFFVWMSRKYKERELVKMSEVFDGYERQYCELSANLAKKCTAIGSLDGGDFIVSCVITFDVNYLVIVSFRETGNGVYHFGGSVSV